MAYFEIKGLKKSFGNNEVLKGIDLTLEKGEVLSIIGSSGGGKTTRMRAKSSSMGIACSAWMPRGIPRLIKRRRE